MVKNICPQLPDVLLPWYEKNKRDLPWRQDRDPYHIWVSEIMLQQTRVEAVKGYYARFLQHFPNIEALASADDELLHKMWEGLGYYSRVRNLKKAAQVIQERHNGKFPGKYDDVLALPGIGTYTAGAVCSIAFNQPTPAVDGNVLRVVSRLANDNTPIDDPAFKSAVNNALGGGFFTAAEDGVDQPADKGAVVLHVRELCPFFSFTSSHFILSSLCLISSSWRFRHRVWDVWHRTWNGPGYVCQRQGCPVRRARCDNGHREGRGHVRPSRGPQSVPEGCDPHHRCRR